jgi:hypothetical protein
LKPNPGKLKLNFIKKKKLYAFRRERVKAGDTSAKKEKAGDTSAKEKVGDASAAMREPELWELQRMQRRFSIPPSSASDIQLAQQQLRLAGTSEDLHAWSIYRQV